MRRPQDALLIKGTSAAEEQQLGTAQERSSNAASDAVVNADTVLIDDVTAGVGRHGRLRV